MVGLYRTSPSPSSVPTQWKVLGHLPFTRAQKFQKSKFTGSKREMLFSLQNIPEKIELNY